jgi:hypothetical protein
VSKDHIAISIKLANGNSKPKQDYIVSYYRCSCYSLGRPSLKAFRALRATYIFTQHSPRHGDYTWIVGRKEPRLNMFTTVHATSLNPAISISSSPFAVRSRLAGGKKLWYQSSRCLSSTIRSNNLFNYTVHSIAVQTRKPEFQARLAISRLA